MTQTWQFTNDVTDRADAGGQFTSWICTTKDGAAMQIRHETGPSRQQVIERSQLIAAAPALLRAALVIDLTPAITAWLQANDPKALEQLRAAISEATRVQS